MSRHFLSGGIEDAPGLARTALAAPAMDPASAICAILRSGKGLTIRFATEKAPKRSELTPAIPSNGLAIPTKFVRRSIRYCRHAERKGKGKEYPCRVLGHPPSALFALGCRLALSEREEVDRPNMAYVNIPFNLKKIMFRHS